MAVNVIKGYEGSVEVSELTAEAYEHSEMLLYKASLLEEGGKPQAALEQLDASKARHLIAWDVLTVKHGQSKSMGTVLSPGPL